MVAAYFAAAGAAADQGDPERRIAVWASIQEGTVIKIMFFATNRFPAQIRTSAHKRAF